MKKMDFTFAYYERYHGDTICKFENEKLHEDEFKYFQVKFKIKLGLK